MLTQCNIKSGICLQTPSHHALHEMISEKFKELKLGNRYYQCLFIYLSVLSQLVKEIFFLIFMKAKENYGLEQ